MADSEVRSALQLVELAAMVASMVLRLQPERPELGWLLVAVEAEVESARPMRQELAVMVARDLRPVVDYPVEMALEVQRPKPAPVLHRIRVVEEVGEEAAKLPQLSASGVLVGTTEPAEEAVALCLMVQLARMVEPERTELRSFSRSRFSTQRR